MATLSAVRRRVARIIGVRVGRIARGIFARVARSDATERRARRVVEPDVNDTTGS
jgi:hypothetical protein